MDRPANRLINESSPYLQQHAYNPVDWHPWGEEAFEKARSEDKLMLISVGYSACHWCHVMEHETFEDSTAAAFMNAHFVSIKVDREERPDVDQVYMNAVQLMTQRGGWPLNCFALPDGRPVFGGTYFPKDKWMEVMQSLIDLKNNEPERMLEYADKLTKGIQSSELVSINEDESAPDIQELDNLVNHWSSYWDLKKGGPDRAPKFPLPNNFEFLMQYGHLGEHSSTLNYVHTTLEKMARGGIYDQIGGGFARYSTDGDWKVPHFEKMLYDNAQLVSLYSHAYQLSKRDEYKRVVEETIEFVNRELTGKDGELYSALDADSEGEEGKFYVWSLDEAQSILGKDYATAEAYFNFDRNGLWEGHYIPLRMEADSVVAGKLNLSESELREAVDRITRKLFDARAKRIRPGLDDKSLTSWNALMISGLADAYAALGTEEYLNKARKTASFIWDKQKRKDGGLNHSYKAGKSTINGYLEDYSFTIEAFIRLYEVTFEEEWLEKAKELTQYVTTHFYDEQSKMYWFTSDLDPPLIARKQEIHDNVIPASNSSLAKGLYKLGSYYYDKDLLDRSAAMLHNIRPEMSFGQNYSNWGILMLHQVKPFYEVAVTGSGWKDKMTSFHQHYLPNAIFMGADKNSGLPLLESKFFEETTIFVCQNKSCQQPVTKVDDALKQMQW